MRKLIMSSTSSTQACCLDTIRLGGKALNIITLFLTAVIGITSGSDDSFSSVPSLLTNCLVPLEDISSSVPVQKSSSGDDDTIDQQEIPSSPASETNSSTSSHATGITSLVGGARKKGFHTPAEGKSKDFNHERESNSNVVIRRPTTLEELIMMSRRRSYQRKAVQMKKQNLSMFSTCIPR
ncbi:hypothetical protein Dsin_014880 [Dipteronia sinensis]|uniref:Uncharacterized protein n=1 Tax=Dipteronia sinensis TaxID=43782 RepID=A0AAE0ANG0_9ROSI|nr:hypothetical protein Dsin_014877 [Dipteronia sinensis]KAK3220910.1 hypothetical protein Dsin_014880 [Dipteronia sinensis]